MLSCSEPKMPHNKFVGVPAAWPLALRPKRPAGVSKALLVAG